jgi:hypothetical protein
LAVVFPSVEGLAMVEAPALIEVVEGCQVAVGPALIRE